MDLLPLWLVQLSGPSFSFLGSTELGGLSCQGMLDGTFHPQGPGSPPSTAMPWPELRSRGTHMHVVHVIVTMPPLLHVGAQGRNGRGALLEG